MLRLIGDLPAGTPVAFEAAFGWGWLVELLEDYGFEPHLVHPLRCKAIASARLKNDKVDAAILAQLLRADLLPGGVDRPAGGPAAPRAAAAPGRPGPAAAPSCATGSTRWLADHGYDRSGSYWTGPGRGWLAGLDLPSASREIVADCLAVIDGLAPVIDRIDGELRAARQGRPPGQGPDHAARASGQFTALVMLAEIGDISPVRPAPASWPAGPGSPRRCAARTGPSGTGTSPSRARPGCGGC